MSKLFVISAASGAGKTTLVKKLLHRIQEKHAVRRVITYTTKKARNGERDGIDYHFITEQDFKNRIKNSFFLEYSTAYGAYYGSPRSIIEDIEQGVSYIAILDRVGAQKIRKQISSAVYIWIYTANIQELEKRLKKRGTESSDEISQRLVQAQKEIEQEHREKLYQYHIENDNFDRALEKIEEMMDLELSFSTQKIR